jgi:hypothetical protein
MQCPQSGIAMFAKLDEIPARRSLVPNKTPGAVSRPGANRDFQFHE